MSGEGAPDLSGLDASRLRVTVVAASWHDTVMDGLVAGATNALKEMGVADPEIVRVPGSFELPVVAGKLARLGRDAVHRLTIDVPRAVLAGSRPV